MRSWELTDPLTVLLFCPITSITHTPGMWIIAGSRENYPAVNAIFLAVKHYFSLQNVFKCCQKIVIYLFHLFTPSNLGIACQRHARVGLQPKYPPIIARFLPVKNFSYIPVHYPISAQIRLVITDHVQ